MTEDRWQLVPVELTQAMLDATCATEEDDAAMRSTWAELLRACPSPTPAADEVEAAIARVIASGGYKADRISSGCFDYCAGGCNCKQEAETAIAEAKHDAAVLRAAILAMAEENDRLATLARANNDLARHEVNARRELQAENARMREALEAFVASLTNNGRNRDTMLSINHDELRELVRAAALSGGTTYE